MIKLGTLVLVFTGLLTPVNLALAAQPAKAALPACSAWCYSLCEKRVASGITQANLLRPCVNVCIKDQNGKRCTT